MLSLSKHAAQVRPSEIRIMSVECARVQGINLAQGICDTEVPEPVLRGAIDAMHSGQNQYTRLDGIGELRLAIARKMRDYNKIACDPESEIVVTCGSTGAFYAACLSLLDPGDEVVVFEPFYGYHVNTLLALAVKPQFITLRAPDWSFTPQQLAQAISSRTKAIVVNSPANPSGKVFSREELSWIADCCRGNDLFLFTDEIYEYFLYDGHQHISPASMPGMADRTISISGFSKTFSITGWRIGYAVCSAQWASAIGYFHDLAYICAPSPLQRGVTSGLEELLPDFYRNLAAEYLKKRDLLCDALAAGGLEPRIPQGSYYVLADGSALPGKTSKQKAMYLLETTGVAAVPGDSFFHNHSAKDLMRFCFAKTDNDLREACQRLERLRVKV